MKAATQHIRFISRSIRAGALRVLLHFSLIVCFLEDWLRPPKPVAGKRVLMIVFGGLGDCLLFDPLFRRMKEQWPGVRIDVLTGCFESMWEGLASIDYLMYFGRNTFKPPWAYFSLFRRIYRNRYSLAVEGLGMMPKRGTWSIVTSLMLQASQAPERVGRQATGRLVYRPNREPGFLGADDAHRSRHPQNSGRPMHPSVNRLIELPLPQDRHYHEAYYVAQAIGVDFFRRPEEPRLRPDPIQMEWAARILRDYGLRESDTLVGLVVETTYPLKRWPVERFQEIVQRGIQDGMKFVLLGHMEHVPQIEGQFPADRLINLSSQTTLAQMIAVIRHCDLFVAADTGPAHVAQACGIPSIVLFGPSNDREFGPVDLDKHSLITPAEILPCRPCVLGPCVRGQSCMNLISVDTVYATLKTKFLSIRTSREDGTAVPSSTAVPGSTEPRREPGILRAI